MNQLTTSRARSFLVIASRARSATFVIARSARRARRGNLPAIATKLILLSFLTSCAATPPKPPQGPIYQPIVKIHEANYRETWFSTLSAVKKLPLSRVDKNSGVIDSDWISTFDPDYFSTFGGDPLPQEVRFKLHIHLAELYAAPETRVSITKEEQVPGYLPDTYTTVTSSGTSEAVIHYRIDRQIDLNRKLLAAGLQPIPIKVPAIEGLQTEESSIVLY